MKGREVNRLRLPLAPQAHSPPSPHFAPCISPPPPLFLLPSSSSLSPTGSLDCSTPHSSPLPPHTPLPLSSAYSLPVARTSLPHSLLSRSFPPSYSSPLSTLSSLALLSSPPL